MTLHVARAEGAEREREDPLHASLLAIVVLGLRHPVEERRDVLRLRGSARVTVTKRLSKSQARARARTICETVAGVPSGYSTCPSISGAGMPIAPPGKYGL